MSTRGKETWKALVSRRRFRAGFTVIEATIATTLFGTMIAAVAWLAADTSRLASSVDSTATLQLDVRNGMDQFVQDLYDSSSVASSYTSGSTTYTSSTSGTLVLVIPSYTYDSSGNPLASYTDHIIYHLVGSSAPYTLNRLVVPATGSPRAAVSDTVIAQNVQSATLICFASQSWTGDGSTKAFTMNAAVSGSGATLLEQVTSDGAAVGTGSGSAQASFSGSTLTFGTAPASLATIDALYSVDPSASGSYVSGVQIDLTLSSTNPANVGAGQTQTVEFKSICNLRNH